MHLQIEYTGEPDNLRGQHPLAVWQEAVANGAQIRLNILFAEEEVQEAIEWARKQKFTYERDGELDVLLASWATNGAHNIDEIELLDP